MRRHLCVVGLLGLFAACSPSGTSAADAAADSGVAVATDAAVAAAADGAVPVGRDAAILSDLSLALATVHGRVIYDKYNNGTNIPARSAAIGFVDGSAATNTDSLGNYTLAAAPNVSRVLLVDLSGEISVQRALVSPPGSLAVDLHVLDIDAYVGAVSRLHGNFDMFDHGAVAVRFKGSARGGYGATLGAVHGGAFVYSTTPSQNPVESAVTLAAGDTIYFYAVTPGATTLSLTAPAGLSPCRDDYAPGITNYPVVADTMTEIVLSCP